MTEPRYGQDDLPPSRYVDTPLHLSIGLQPPAGAPVAGDPEPADAGTQQRDAPPDTATTRADAPETGTAAADAPETGAAGVDVPETGAAGVDATGPDGRADRSSASTDVPAAAAKSWPGAAGADATGPDSHAGTEEGVADAARPGSDAGVEEAGAAAAGSGSDAGTRASVTRTDPAHLAEPGPVDGADPPGSGLGDAGRAGTGPGEAGQAAAPEPVDSADGDAPGWPPDAPEPAESTVTASPRAAGDAAGRIPGLAQVEENGPATSGPADALLVDGGVVGVSQPPADAAQKPATTDVDEATSGGGAGAQELADPERLRAAVEAVLLVVDTPTSTTSLAQVLGRPVDEVAAALLFLQAEYDAGGRGLDLREVADGWRLYSREDFAAYVERFVLDGQQARLTQAALETLAVIAYRQPVTRSRIAGIRGVSVDAVMRTLLTRGLVEECGADPDTGGGLYRTTRLFLEKVGLRSLEELPSLAPLLPDASQLDDVAAST